MHDGVAVGHAILSAAQGERIPIPAMRNDRFGVLTAA
jgi:hypothetical protein